MDETTYTNIKVSIKKLLNIDLNSYKSRADAAPIRFLAGSSGNASWDQYTKLLSSDQKELSKFRDYLTINVSEFFRDQDRWTTLKTKVVPDLIKASMAKTDSSTRGALKIWSAGCSNGSEPYSLSILLDEFAAMRNNHSILATDLDRTILARARARGPYSAEDTRNVYPDQRSKYFDAGGPPYYVKETVGKKVIFKEHNLLLDAFDKDFDLIVCRNVIIYFTMEAKATLYQKFYNVSTSRWNPLPGRHRNYPTSIGNWISNLGGSYYQKGTG